MKTKKYLTEVEPPLTFQEALEEASRCLLCIDPACSKNCPAGTEPGRFIKAIRMKDIRGAAEIIRKNNILAGICARVCPFDKTCEGACKRAKIDRPVRIGKLQRFATDFEKSEDLKILRMQEPTLEKVALIGSGPASLSVATALALKGYRVAVFESRPKAGGILSYGIAPFRLPQDVVDTEIEAVKSLGVEFRMNTHVGRDVSLDGLKKEGFKAFLLAIGRPSSKTANTKGIELDGVVNALEYLYTARSSDGKFDSGRHVIVIGGGNVAMDCANTAKILEADRVTVVYRRRREDMPASVVEMKLADKLGVEWEFETKVDEILGEDGKVSGVRCSSAAKGSFTLPADNVIFAIGQDSHNIDAIASIRLDGNNQIVIDPETFLTSAEGIFAAGDSVNGGKTVVQAIAEGKACAEAIDRYLTSVRAG